MSSNNAQKIQIKIGRLYLSRVESERYCGNLPVQVYPTIGEAMTAYDAAYKAVEDEPVPWKK